MTLGLLQRRAKLKGDTAAPFLLLDSVGFIAGVASAARAIIEDGLREVAARSSLLLLLVDPLHPRWRERRAHALKLLASAALTLKRLPNTTAPDMDPRGREALSWRNGDPPSRAPESSGGRPATTDSSISSNSISNSSGGPVGPAARTGQRWGGAEDALASCVEAKFGGRLIEVWTKFDLVKDEQLFQQLRREMPPNAMPISSLDGTGINELAMVIRNPESSAVTL